MRQSTGTRQIPLVLAARSPDEQYGECGGARQIRSGIEQFSPNSFAKGFAEASPRDSASFWSSSGDGGEFVEVLDVRKRCAVNTLDFGILGFDEVVLVGCVGAISVSQAEVARGEAQWVAGENVARP